MGSAQRESRSSSHAKRTRARLSLLVSSLIGSLIGFADVDTIGPELFSAQGEPCEHLELAGTIQPASAKAHALKLNE